MRIAVAGLGFMGATHVKALQSIPGENLFAVVSGDEAKLNGDLRAIQGNLGAPGEQLDFSRVRKFRSLDAALSDPEIQALDICLPTAQHAPAAFAALRAGKHVFVEKPLALDGPTADALVAESHRIGRILMAGHVLRFFSSYESLADFRPNMGPVRSAFFRRRCAAPAWSRWLSDPVQSGGGAFDLLIHDADMCLHLFGIPRSVSATGYVDLARGIDWMEARLSYPHCGPVVITGGWHHPKNYPFSMEFTVVCENATLDYSSLNRPLTVYRADGTMETIPPRETDPWATQLAYFIACATEDRQPLRCPPEESARAVKLTRAMLESREHQGESVPCQF